MPRLRAADLVAFGLAGAYAWNISHHDFLMHPEPGFHYVGTEMTAARPLREPGQRERRLALADVRATRCPIRKAMPVARSAAVNCRRPPSSGEPPGQVRHRGAADERGRAGEHQRHR